MKHQFTWDQVINALLKGTEYSGHEIDDCCVEDNLLVITTIEPKDRE